MNEKKKPPLKKKPPPQRKRRPRTQLCYGCGQFFACVANHWNLRSVCKRAMGFHVRGEKIEAPPPLPTEVVMKDKRRRRRHKKNHYHAGDDSNNSLSSISDDGVYDGGDIVVTPRPTRRSERQSRNPLQHYKTTITTTAATKTHRQSKYALFADCQEKRKGAKEEDKSRRNTSDHDEDNGHCNDNIEVGLQSVSCCDPNSCHSQPEDEKAAFDADCHNGQEEDETNEQSCHAGDDGKSLSSSSDHNDNDENHGEGDNGKVDMMPVNKNQRPDMRQTMLPTTLSMPIASVNLPPPIPTSCPQQQHQQLLPPNHNIIEPVSSGALHNNDGNGNTEEFNARKKTFINDFVKEELFKKVKFIIGNNKNNNNAMLQWNFPQIAGVIMNKVGVEMNDRQEWWAGHGDTVKKAISKRRAAVSQTMRRMVMSK